MCGGQTLMSGTFLSSPPLYSFKVGFFTEPGGTQGSIKARLDGQQAPPHPKNCLLSETCHCHNPVRRGARDLNSDSHACMTTLIPRAIAPAQTEIWSFSFSSCFCSFAFESGVYVARTSTESHAAEHGCEPLILLPPPP